MQGNELRERLRAFRDNGPMYLEKSLWFLSEIVVAQQRNYFIGRGFSESALRDTCTCGQKILRFEKDVTFDVQHAPCSMCLARQVIVDLELPYARQEVSSALQRDRDLVIAEWGSGRSIPLSSSTCGKCGFLTHSMRTRSGSFVIHMPCTLCKDHGEEGAKRLMS